MANPYFNAIYYFSKNPDLAVAGLKLEDAETHYANYGAAEALLGATSRAPNAWFDIQHYYSSNPDLIAAVNAGQLTVAGLFEHFTTYGAVELRSPAASVVLDDAKLSAYAAANKDLRDAFGITDTANLTAEQKASLVQQFYAHGINEDRPAKPAGLPGEDGVPGSTFTLTNGADFLSPNAASSSSKTTANDDVIRGLTAGDLGSADYIDGGAGNDTLNAVLAAAAKPVIENVENINISFTNVLGDLDLGDSKGYKVVSAKASTAVGTFSNLALGTDVKVEDQAVGATFKFAKATGSTDSANLTVSKATSAAAVTIDAIETVNLSSVGGANNVTINGNKLETLNINGSVSTALTIGATADDVIKTIDASALTANFTVAALTAVKDVTIKGSTANNVLNVAGTKKADIATQGGKDHITVSTTGVATVDAGAGDDTIVISAAGKHVITTGEGKDVITFSGATTAATSNATNTTTVQDFTAGTDKLNLAGVTGGTQVVVGQVTLTSIQNAVDALAAGSTVSDALAAAALLTATQGNIAYFQFDSNTYVYAAQDAAGYVAGDLVVKLAGAVDLSATDFILA